MQGGFIDGYFERSEKSAGLTACFQSLELSLRSR